jgi:hypothetical protein
VLSHLCVCVSVAARHARHDVPMREDWTLLHDGTWCARVGDRSHTTLVDVPSSFFAQVMLDNTTVQGSPTELHVRSGTVNAANSHAS